ncbi:MAG: HD domain-containing protein [Victivallaceae bacterium]
MTDFRCPGQDMRYWKPEDIFTLKCPNCENEIEFFKDEPFRICSSCKAEVRNPKINLGCAKWCKFAKECLGPLAGQLTDVASMCDRLIAEMRKVFGDDRKRIEHALQVLGFAEELLKTESADPLVVKAAAILHDIGIHEAERKYNSAAGNYQEIEGPPIAKKILEQLGLRDEVTEHVCRIIGSHHSAKNIDTPEFRIVWDADWLVNFAEVYPDKDLESKRDLISRIFKTVSGRKKSLQIHTMGNF